MPKIEKIHWGSSFKRAFKKRVAGKPPEEIFANQLKIFVNDPFDSRVKTHKLSGKLEGLWSFSVSYNCRVVFKFLPGNTVLLIDIGSHDEVY